MFIKTTGETIIYIFFKTKYTIYTNIDIHIQGVTNLHRQQLIVDEGDRSARFNKKSRQNVVGFRVIAPQITQIITQIINICKQYFSNNCNSFKQTIREINEKIFANEKLLSVEKGQNFYRFFVA